MLGKLAINVHQLISIIQTPVFLFVHPITTTTLYLSVNNVLVVASELNLPPLVTRTLVSAHV